MFCSLTTNFNEAYNLNLVSVQLFDSLKLFTFVENHQQLQFNCFSLFPPPPPPGYRPKLLISVHIGGHNIIV